MNAVVVREILDRANIQFALIGATAVAFRGLPRFTQDTDFFTTDRRVLSRDLWQDLLRDGQTVDIRQSDFNDPLGGVVRIGHLADQVDIVVGKYKWEQQVIARAERVELFGGTVLLPTRSDLILMKLAAGGYKDLIDAAGLLSVESPDEVIAEVSSRIGDLSSEAQASWAKLMESR